MAVAGCINAYDCAGCYLTTLQQLQSDNIGVGINYTAPSEYGRRQLDYIKYTDKCGCTCCLTGENELRIVATQGVIKNFTLTNDDTNERVIVKWNDLFGSNRAYTMVRYKTGSYPTSITDGTLAVKETTQNQYSTNGYNVSGLTDGTTYYFTAFAVSQDGTIIVVQNKNITTDFNGTSLPIPQMTANTQNGYTATGSIQLGGSTNYWSAFFVSTQGGEDHMFHSQSIGAGNRVYSQIQLPSKARPRYLEIGARKNESSVNLREIRAFELQGSNDGINFTTIFSQSGLGSSWSIGMIKNRTFTNTGKYLYFRLRVQANRQYVAFDYRNLKTTTS